MKFETAAPVTKPVFGKAEQPGPQPKRADIPHWAQDTHNAIRVPAGQAAIGAAIWAFAVALGCIGVYTIVPVRAAFGTLAGIALFLTATTFLGFFAAYWFPYRAEAMDALRQFVEYEEVRDNRDYNRDGVIGSHPVVLNGRAHPETAQDVAERQWREDVTAFVRASFAARSTAEKKLLGLPLTDGRKLTMAQYNAMRDAFIRAGWAEWKTPQNPLGGWTWAAGETVTSLLQGILPDDV